MLLQGYLLVLSGILGIPELNFNVLSYRRLREPILRKTRSLLEGTVIIVLTFRILLTFIPLSVGKEKRKGIYWEIRFLIFTLQMLFDLF
jgi:hypothetical protein